MGYIIDENKQRKHFYRDNYRRVVKAFWVALIIIVLEVLALTYFYVDEAPVKFYSSRSDGLVQALRVYNQPNQSSKPLIN